MPDSLGSLAKGVPLAVCAALAPTPAAAADWSAEIGVVTDYRYRGLSLSNGKPALQGSLSLEHESGAYAELWASTLTGSGASRTEVDATAGYAVTLTEALSLDVSATYYAYPGAAGGNALELTGALEAVRGPLTASLGLSVAPPQRGTRDELGARKTNLYAFAEASYRLTSYPVKLRTKIGFERGPWDMAERAGKWDWSIGGEADLEQARIGVDLVGSDAGDETLVGTLVLAF
jgi:uncharacterized protein (TIGR02001 family)